MSIRMAAILLGMSLCSQFAMAGQSPKVVELYQKARSEEVRNAYDDAVADYKEILRLDPKLGAAYNNLGRLYYNLGRYTDAIPVLAQGLRVDPSMHPAEIMLGASYYQTGAYDQAKPLLEGVIKALPDDRFARITLVHTLIQQGSTDEALTQLHALATRDPKNQEAWYLLGKLQLRLSQEAFARVHSIDPDSPLAHELSGEIMESMKNTPGAIAEYKKALDAAPSDAGAMDHLANAYWHAGEWAEARDGFAAILKQDTNNCLAHWKLANSLDELGETAADALREADAALVICPTLAQARVERARILVRMGKPTEALPELLNAEKTAPDEPSIQILLAKVYKTLGDTTRAAAANAKFQRLEQAEHAGEEKHAADVIRANP